MPVETIIVSIFNYTYQALAFLISLWWIYVPLILFIFVKDLWIKHKRDQIIQNLEWITLEVIPPQQIEKTPYIMEQFFAALHGAYGTINWWDRNIKGKTQKWFSFEAASFGGEIHFFINTPADFRNLVEAQIYAQYPDAEVVQTEDYVNILPTEIPNQEYNSWGTELIFSDNFVYPIRTYPIFSKDALTAEERIDPLSSLMETMGNIKSGEHIWIQTLVRPIGGEWKDEGKKEKNKILDRDDSKSNFLIEEINAWIDEFRDVLSRIVFNEGVEPTEEESKEDKGEEKLSKAEKEQLKAVEDKTSKIGYETIIRFIYIAKQEFFSMSNVSAIMGNFKQLNTQNLNGFKPNPQITPSIDYRIRGKTIREKIRKRRILFDFKRRYFPQYSSFLSYLNPLIFQKFPFIRNIALRYQPMIMNIEELATVYHFPSISVEAPFVPKTEAKKAEPPRTLPTEE